MQDDIDILDSEDAEAIRYPSIKNEGEPEAQEHKITLKTTDIEIPGIQETTYFPLNFCLEDIVIDSIAKKYAAAAENYPMGDDTEHFLIGTTACRSDRKKINCPYMRKANDKIAAAEGIDFSDMFAIYLFELDGSNENRQKLLVMTKNRLYVMYNTQAFESFSYRSIRFVPEGIELKEFGEDFSQMHLSYTFDERFLNFAREFMLLRTTTLADVRERHPFSSATDDKNIPDMIADMKIVTDETDPKPVIAKRNAYMRFLVDTAAAEGRLDAQTVLKLCYMAREFRISADSMTSWLIHAAGGGIKKNKLHQELTKIWGSFHFKYKFAFVQDLLEIGTDSNGNFRREELLKILRRSQFGVEKFVDRYLAYVSERRAAEKKLQVAWQEVPALHFKHSVRAQNYANRMNLQLIAMEAMVNEQ